MSCESFEERIALAAGGDLAAADTEGLESHLRACRGCRRFAEEMRASHRAA